jgi:Flp pilus assembly protein TadD
LQTAWDLNPNVEETRQKLMVAYARAKKDVPKQLTIKEENKLPSDPKQLVYIGYNDMTHGDLDGAINALGAAVKKEPNNTDARRYLAHAFAKVGDFDNANAQFKALTSIQGLTADDSLIYADSLEKFGDCEQAVQVLNHGLSANQDNSPMRVRLAQIYYRLGQQRQGDQVSEAGLSRAKSFEDRQKFLDLINTGANQRQFKGPKDNDTDNGHG